MGTHLPVFGCWARRWINHGDWRTANATPDLWLPSQLTPVYQIYTAWWQLAAQDINPIAYAPEFTSCTGLDSYPGQYAGQTSEQVFSVAVANATATLSTQPCKLWSYIFIIIWRWEIKFAAFFRRPKVKKLSALGGLCPTIPWPGSVPCLAWLLPPDSCYNLAVSTPCLPCVSTPCLPCSPSTWPRLTALALVSVHF